jgi:acyl-CoA dehydrogenase
VIHSFHVGLADGPTEVHKVTVAREVLKAYSPSTSLFPDYHGIAAEERARDLYRDLLDDESLLVS